MTSPVVRAATRLLESIEGYLTFCPTDTATMKLVPVNFSDGEGHPATSAAACTVLQFLESLPYLSSRALSGAAAGATEEDDVMSVALYLAEVVASHLRCYEAAVLPGGGGASHRGAWIAWVVLNVYRRFAEDAAAEQSDWVVGEYSRRLQAVADLYDAKEDNNLDSAQSMTSFLRGVSSALEADERARGADRFQRNTNAFDAFFQEHICPLVAQCVHPEVSDKEDATVLFPFHAYSQSFTGRQLAAACLGSLGDKGVAAVVEEVSQHLAAHEAHTEALAAKLPTSGENGRAAASAAACAYRDAIRHGLGLIRGAVQVVPTSLYADEEVLGSGEGSLPGAWLVEHTRSKSRRTRLHLSPRVSLVLPGIGIAATEFGVSEAELATGRGVAPVGKALPVSLTPASTLMVAPAEARQSLVWQCGHNSEGSVSSVATAALHPVRALYLIAGDLSPGCDDSTLWTALESAVKRTCHGDSVVLIAVKAAVSQNALERMLSWGCRSSRVIVVVGSVGEWGMRQLALRFDSVPNYATAAATRSRAGHTLRAVEGGRAGVLLVPLDEISQPRELTGGPVSAAKVAFVETRRRLLVVVGECAPLPSAGPLVRPPTVTRMHPDTESSSSDGDSESETTHSDDSGDGCAKPLAALPHVRCCVLVGGASPPQQTECLAAFHRVLESLVHRRALPPRLRREMAPAPRIEQMLLSSLDDGLVSSQTQGGEDKDAAYFRSRVANALHEALWQYLLVGEQRRLGGSPVEVAWDSLLRAKCGRDEDVGADAEPFAYRETYLQTRAAYMTVGRCLDELCSTALLLGARGESDDIHHPSPAPHFAPVIR